MTEQTVIPIADLQPIYSVTDVDRARGGGRNMFQVAEFLDYQAREHHTAHPAAVRK